MKNGKLWFVALTLMIFIIGVLCGVIVDRGPMRRQCERPTHGVRDSRHGRKMYVEKLTKNLSLSAVQNRQLQEILKKNEPEMLRIRKDIRSKFVAYHEKVSGQIMAILDDGQKEKFRKIMKEQEKRMRHEENEKHDHR
jgi:hypothetical protein